MSATTSNKYTGLNLKSRKRKRDSLEKKEKRKKRRVQVLEQSSSSTDLMEEDDFRVLTQQDPISESSDASTQEIVEEEVVERKVTQKPSKRFDLSALKAKKQSKQTTLEDKVDWTSLNGWEDIKDRQVVKHPFVKRLLKSLGYDPTSGKNPLGYLQESREDILFDANNLLGVCWSSAQDFFKSDQAKKILRNYGNQDDDLLVGLVLLWEYIAWAKSSDTLLLDILVDDEEQMITGRRRPTALGILVYKNKKWEELNTRQMILRTKLFKYWHEMQLEDDKGKLTTNVLIQLYKRDGIGGILETLETALKQLYKYPADRCFKSIYDRASVSKNKWCMRHFYGRFHPLDDTNLVTLILVQSLTLLTHEHSPIENETFVEIKEYVESMKGEWEDFEMEGYYEYLASGTISVESASTPKGGKYDW